MDYISFDEYFEDVREAYKGRTLPPLEAIRKKYETDTGGTAVFQQGPSRREFLDYNKDRGLGREFLSEQYDEIYGEPSKLDATWRSLKRGLLQAGSSLGSTWNFLEGLAGKKLLPADDIKQSGLGSMARDYLAEEAADIPKARGAQGSVKEGFMQGNLEDTLRNPDWWATTPVETLMSQVPVWIGAALGGPFGAGIAGAGMESGQTFDEAIKKDLENPIARTGGTAAATGILNSIPFLGNTGGPVRRGLVGAVKEGITESAEEFPQAFFEDRPMSEAADQAIEVFFPAMIAGGPMTATTGTNVEQRTQNQANEFAEVAQELGGEQEIGVEQDPLETVVRDVAGRWESGPNIEIVEAGKDLPDGIKKSLGEDIEAAYDGTDTVYMVRGNLAPERYAPVLFHEAVGHYGVERVIPNYDAFMDQAFNLANKDPVLRPIFEEVSDLYADADARTLAAETIAKYVEQNPNTKHPLIERLYASLRAFAQKLGLPITMNRADLNRTLVKALRGMEGKGRGSGQAKAARKKDVEDIKGRTLEETLSRIPDSERAVSENVRRTIDGGSFVDLDPTLPNEGFLPAQRLGENAANDMLQKAWDEAAKEAGLPQELADQVRVPPAERWNAAMSGSNEARYWYERSADGFANGFFSLPKDRLSQLIDVVAASSGNKRPFDNVKDAISVMSQDVRGEPVTVGVRDPASLGSALSPEALDTHKFGNFSNTMQLVAGLKNEKPLPTVDLQMSNWYGIPHSMVASDPRMYEAISKHLIKVRDMQNNFNKGQPWESWQVQAAAWVEQRGTSDPDDYASAMPEILSILQEAGVPLENGKIGMSTLVDPRTAAVLSPTSQSIGQAGIATVETRTKLTNTGARAAEIFDELKTVDEPFAKKAVKEYERIQRKTMEALGQRRSVPGKKSKDPSLLNELFSTIIGRKVDLSRIDTRGYGTFDQEASPNMRIPLNVGATIKGYRTRLDLTDAEAEYVLAALGKELKQAAMASSQFTSTDGDGDTATLYVPRYDNQDISQEDLAAVEGVLGFPLNYSKAPNGWVIDVNIGGFDTTPDFHGTMDALESILGKDFKILERKYSSKYLESTDYERIIEAFEAGKAGEISDGGRGARSGNRGRTRSLPDIRADIGQVAAEQDEQFGEWADRYESRLKSLTPDQDQVVPKASRSRDVPKKTVKGYKLLELNADGKPHTKYVDHEKVLEPGVWYEAVEGPYIIKNGRKYVKGKGLQAAWRPGYHVVLDSPNAPQIGVKGPDGKLYRGPNQVWAEVEIGADKDYQAEADASYRGNLQYIPANGKYEYSNQGSRWAIAGNMKINKLLSDEEVASLNKKAGKQDNPRLPKASRISTDLEHEQRVRQSLAKQAEFDAGVLSVYMKLAKENKGDIEAQRRGVRQWTDTEKAAAEMLAGDMGMTNVAQLVAANPGATANAEELQVMAAAMHEGLEKVRVARDNVLRNSSPENLAVFKAALDRLAFLQAPFMGYRAEAGRSLNILKKMAPIATDMNDLLDVYVHNPGDLIKLAKDLESGNVGKKVREKYTPTTTDKVLEWYYNSILSGPATHLVNLGGNTAFGVTEEVSKQIGLRISGEGQAANARLAAFSEGLMRGIINAKEAFRTEIPQLDQQTKMEGQPDVRGAIGGDLGRLVRIPGRALQAEDEFAKGILYTMELHQLAAQEARGDRQLFDQIISNPPREIQKQAVEAARRGTFTNKLGGSLETLHHGMVRAKWPKFLIPFVQTPTNIIKRAFDYSPLGLLQLVGDTQLSRDLKGQNGKVAQRTAMARQVIGAGLVGLIAKLAMEGLISGNGPPDPREKALRRQRDGWQPYSIKIGDQWVSYLRFDPLAIPMGVVADTYELIDMMGEKEVDEIALGVVKSLSNNVMNKTWMSGVSEFAQALNDPMRYGERWYSRFGTAFAAPNIIGQTTYYNDPYIRVARGIVDNVKSRYPMYRYEMSKLIGISGEPIKNANQTFMGVPTPLRTSEVTPEDPVAAAMLDAGVIKGKPSRKIMGVELTDEEYESYSSLVQKMRWQALTPMTSSPGFSQMPKYFRAKQIERVWDQVGDKARAAWMMQNPRIIQSATKEEAMVLMR